MEKAYNPAKYEAKIYKLWEKSGAFKPAKDPKAKPYSILMPPPNANADLHIGHALTTAIQDILIRYARSQGKTTLYLPGADHAGFETQVVYERKLEEEGKSRFDFTRAELYDQIKDFVLSNKGNMEAQQRSLGASCDWSRNTFTLDDHIIKTAYVTFKQLDDDGLLYRGKRTVNYCTFHGTSFSDLEVEYKPNKSQLWEIAYSVLNSEEEIIVATARPETMLGDTAVAVHPDDKRYKNLVGKNARLPIVGREIPIIADEAVDSEFGTGAVKVTPAHDHTDFDIAERHNLPLEQIIGFNGKIIDSPALKEFTSLTVKQARRAVVKKLKQLGVLRSEKTYDHQVAVCYKCGTTIEPLPLDQWLIRMKPLATEALKALENNEIMIIPARFKKTLYQWLENIKDWNVSRQIVWGIPIPAYFNKKDRSKYVIGSETDAKKAFGNGNFIQDQDTFDTWFSSGQWPFATLHFPNGADFKRFYPTSVMETAGEIIFFWVARMIMLGLYRTGTIPFKTVYLHGLVLDEHGKKMSKSRGNVINPMQLIDKYGADATRLGLVVGRSAGLNQGFSEKRVEAYRNFANKLWNVARFSVEKLGQDFSPTHPKLHSPADHWIVSRLTLAAKKMSQALDNYRFSEAAELLYSFVWNDLADWYIELSKIELNKPVLVYVLETTLKLAHPFAPFISEAIWQELSWTKTNLISQRWPNVDLDVDSAEVKLFGEIRSIILQIRQTKKAMALDNHMTAFWGPVEDRTFIEVMHYVTALAKIKAVKMQPSGGVRIMASRDIRLDVPEELIKDYKRRMKKQLDDKIHYLGLLEAKLNNPAFVKKAPKPLVATEKIKADQTKVAIKELEESLAKLKTS